jgi:cytosine/adenosine deaminase-related metal-dependent hydrolase
VIEVYAADWVLPVGGEPIEQGAVAVRDGVIVAVAEAGDIAGDVRHEFPDSVILPGFVNAHVHLEYAVYAGFGDGLPFGPWLRLHIERKGRLEFTDMVAIARLGAAECLASGITTVADASFSGASAIGVDELGLRAIVCLEVFGEPGDIEARFEPNRRRIASSLSDRVRLGVSPHAPYTCTASLYRASSELGVPLSTHLAESPAEDEWLVGGSGPMSVYADLLTPPPGETAIRHLAREGVLSAELIAAHCVTVDAEDTRLLVEHDVAVVHCPRSNALLGCGVAPVAMLRGAGLRVGLGTDSPASTPSLDIFDEMRTAIVLARAVAGDPAALPPASALELATLGSARALGLEAEIGSLEPGKRADLCVVSLAGSPFLPLEDPIVAVVLGGRPERVCRTIVGGATRFVRGGFEWHELRQNAAAARARMLASVASESSL